MELRCFVCGNAEFKRSDYFADILGIPTEEVYRCTNCGLAKRQSTAVSIACPPSYLNETARIYVRAAALDEVLYERKLRDIHAIAPTATRLLELGAGKGGFLLAAAKNYTVQGIDIDSENVRHCRSLGLQVSCGRFDDRDIPPEVTQNAPFDVVYTNHVMEHVSDPLQFLLNARQLLSPRGILSLEIPQEGRSIVVRAKEASGLWRHRPRKRQTQHNWFFTKRALELLFERAGYQILRITTADSIPSDKPARRLYAALNAAFGWGFRLYVLARPH